MGPGDKPPVTVKFLAASQILSVVGVIYSAACCRTSAPSVLG